MTTQADRQQWMGALAKADPETLQALFKDITPQPSWEQLRAPEPGLVMVRGRSGGVGNPFNLGEMTVTRSAVRLDSGETGVSYVAGRDKVHAETAAVLDAMLQTSEWHETVKASVIDPLQSAQAGDRDQRLRQRAATRVDFFTMTRTREDKA